MGLPHKDQMAYLAECGESSLWLEPGRDWAGLYDRPVEPKPAPPPRKSQPVATQSDTPKAKAVRDELATPDRSHSAVPALQPEVIERIRARKAVHQTNPFADLTASVAQCQQCGLHQKRTHTVFGEGSTSAQVMFVGEGPGAEEDRQGRPFVGPAGLLLTDIIEKGMKLARSEVYIANIVKCRPPGNRNPQPEEIEACSSYLQQQIDEIRPTVIVALGKIAAQTLCQSDLAMGRMRGNWFRYNGIDVMPTWHPAYLLRTPKAKRETWEDIQQVMARVAAHAQGDH